MARDYYWDRMLDEFRQLGGTADNVVQRAGPLGNGLFPLDPERPVRVHVPGHLLVDVEHVVLEGDDLVIGEKSGISTEVAAFFARYQKHFSWGASGRTDSETFERSLQALPSPLRKRLRELALLDLDYRQAGEWSEVIRRSFVNSRKIDYRERSVLMPVAELINHSPRSRGYNVNDGIGVEGRFDDEVTVMYSVADPLQRFFTYGFASHELVAFSLPTRFTISGNMTVEVRNLTDSINRVGKLPVPHVEEREKRRILSHLRIGSEGSPRLPRTLMRKALPDLDAEAADEAFDRIRNANLTALCDLLDLTEGVEACGLLRRAIVHQLRTASHCFGSRPDGA